MENDEAKIKRYLARELYWELEQHPQVISPFGAVELESIEVLSFRGYDDLQVRVSGVTYNVHLSWNMAAPPAITRVEDSNAA